MLGENSFTLPCGVWDFPFKSCQSGEAGQAGLAGLMALASGQLSVRLSAGCVLWSPVSLVCEGAWLSLLSDRVMFRAQVSAPLLEGSQS